MFVRDSSDSFGALKPYVIWCIRDLELCDLFRYTICIQLHPDENIPLHLLAFARVVGDICAVLFLTHSRGPGFTLRNATSCS